MKRIESRANEKIKSVASLRIRSEREERRLFCFEGVHLVEEYLRAGFLPKELFVREDASKAVRSLAERAGCEVTEVTEAVYDKLTNEKSPQGIFAVAEFLPGIIRVGKDMAKSEAAKEITGTALILESLQDAGNVGTIVRTAAALDAAVILAGACADIYSAKTVRATMGAMFFTRLYLWDDACDAAETLSESRRVLASALSVGGLVLGRDAISANDCFVIGNEGNGVSEELISKCHATVRIPMTHMTESLNAASAATVLLWEAGRTRL